MNILDVLEALDLGEIIDWDKAQELGLEDIELEVHFQPSYPLKARVQNARVLDGKHVLALAAGEEYGSGDAWDEE